MIWENLSMDKPALHLIILVQKDMKRTIHQTPKRRNYSSCNNAKSLSVVLANSQWSRLTRWWADKVIFGGQTDESDCYILFLPPSNLNGLLKRR
jgi:hypothetical protein